jgi:hypothetical protein
MEKTYKVGEYAVGGIVTISFKNDIFKIQFKDWNTKKVLLEKITKDKVEGEIFLEENSTSYYADKIINFK